MTYPAVVSIVVGARGVGLVFLRRLSAISLPKIAALPTELAVGWCRLGLSLLGLLAIYADPPFNSAAEATARATLTLYTTLAFAHVLLARRSKALARGLHVADMVVSITLVVEIGGASSPFYVFFVFSLVAGALQWGWRAAAITSGILIAVLWLTFTAGLTGGVVPPGPDVDSLILRTGSLIIGAVVLGLYVAREESTKRRLAALASFPYVSASPHNGSGALAAALEHVACVMEAESALAIWAEQDEPHFRLCSWKRGAYSESLENATVLVPVSSNLKSKEFIFDGQRLFIGHDEPAAADSIDQVVSSMIVEAFSAKTCAGAPFRTSACSGWLLLLNKKAWSAEEMQILSIAGGRIGAEVSERLLIEQAQSALAERERMRIARDLHDGILQTLAAASMRLRIGASEDPVLSDNLKDIKAMLISEAKRIRTFIEDSRDAGARTTGQIAVADQMGKRAAALRRQWNCSLEFVIEPPDLKTSLANARAFGHLVSEAVSNAVRHGSASNVWIRLERRTASLAIIVTDNGVGLEAAKQAYGIVADDARALGPRSLKDRVEELGGTLHLVSSVKGTTLEIEMPE